MNCFVPRLSNSIILKYFSNNQLQAFQIVVEISSITQECFIFNQTDNHMSYELSNMIIHTLKRVSPFVKGGKIPKNSSSQPAKSPLKGKCYLNI